jgi:hypothetical protein
MHKIVSKYSKSHYKTVMAAPVERAHRANRTAIRGKLVSLTPAPAPAPALSRHICMEHVMEQLQSMYSYHGRDRISREVLIIDAHVIIYDTETVRNIALRHIALPDLRTYITSPLPLCPLQELDDYIRSFQLRYMRQWQCDLHIVIYMNEQELHEIDCNSVTISQTGTDVLRINPYIPYTLDI